MCLRLRLAEETGGLRRAYVQLHVSYRLAIGLAFGLLLR